MLYGLDVHPDFQAGLKIEALPAQGYSFMVTKATEGTSYYADGFADWVKRVRKAGMIPGAYHWIHHGNVSAQVDFFLSKLALVGGPHGLLIQLDCEDDATFADVKQFAARWRDMTEGHPLLIYTGAWWWNAPGRRWNGNSVTPYLWHSQYLAADADTVPDDPAKFAARAPADWWRPGYGDWPVATILQFSSRGDAGGLGNKVDLNATRMDRADLLALTGVDMALTDDEWESQQIMAYRVKAILLNTPTVVYGVNPRTKKAYKATEANPLYNALKSLGDAVSKLTTAQQTPTTPADVPVVLTAEDRAAIVADLVAALGPGFEAAAERAVRKVAADAAE